MTMISTWEGTIYSVKQIDVYNKTTEYKDLGQNYMRLRFQIFIHRNAEMASGLK